ncbi:MFS transporter [Spirillospora sp. CA-294931]|uniref:MFS transporter n=1 Tax=Spirillospora sp. CA-294931 TaxID=3240042 RepID=UPI003D8F025A
MTMASARFRDVFGSGAFRALFAVQTLIVLADTMRMLALSVLVFERTGSSLAAAVTFAAGFLPHVVGGMFLLSLADRLRPRTLLAGFHALWMAVTVLLALVELPVALVIALPVLTGLVAPVARAATQGMLPELLPGDAYVLGRSLFTMTAASAQVAGHGAAGMLLLAGGPPTVLWVAASGGAVAAVIAWWGLDDRPPRRTGTGMGIGETLRVNRSLMADARTRALLFAQWLPISLAVGAEGVVIAYAAELGRPGAAGLIMAAFAAGMLVGNLVVGRFAAPDLRERLVLALALVNAVPLLLFALEPGMVVTCVIGVVSGFGLSYEVGLQRPFVDAVPEERHGQALGLAGIGVMTGQALAMAGAGGLAEVVPPGVAMAAFGAAAAVSAVWLCRRAVLAERPAGHPTARTESGRRTRA